MPKDLHERRQAFHTAFAAKARERMPLQSKAPAFDARPVFGTDSATSRSIAAMPRWNDSNVWSPTNARSGRVSSARRAAILSTVLGCIGLVNLIAPTAEQVAVRHNEGLTHG